MTTNDHHFLREDRGDRWRRIAGHIAAHPADLQTALANIERWLARGRVHPAPLLEWRRRIQAAMESPKAFESFVRFLAEENHDAGPLKSCSPFAGLAPPPESAMPRS
jgi:hypothetical protein